ncbi:uncharacterized protein [Aegilops tauschii subsp. strangulata]|uniref:TF-B3 domain-containing protein n=1 Tax=Aegilops tauschii subsp. strangulata TaxID=200361 RepID=A0A453QS46_AEGTS|nr:uncharacterized protein LOC120969821 [Aegilops tauschii subsp. strangulata]
MVCPLCRCPGAPCVPFAGDHGVPEAFDVVLDENCFRRMYIPCNVRASLAAYIQEHRNVAQMSGYKRIEPALLTFESRSYAAVFKHRGRYSKFCGAAWNELTQDYALSAGDRVVFTLDHSVFDLKVETYRGGHRIFPTPDCAFEKLTDAKYQLVCSAVMPRGLQFNYHDNQEFVTSLFRTSFFLGCMPYVHVLTPTNTEKFLMKIPKAVVSSLKVFIDVPMSANVCLEAFKGELHVITPSSYSLGKKDGRMVIARMTFNQFLAAASYAKDNVFLITFKECRDRSVSTVFQQLK